MADPARARKVADRIKVIVAEYLEFRLKDERLGFVTITDCRVTGDLQHASVFYTVFGCDEERQASADVLEANKGRHPLRRGQGHRHPADAVARVHRRRAARRLPPTSRTCSRRPAPATPSWPAPRRAPRYAGDADPYRKPVDELDGRRRRPERRRLASTAEGIDAPAGEAVDEDVQAR